MCQRRSPPWLPRSAQALERAGDRLESLLIVGGPEIVPFNMAANPTFYDGDQAVPSDCLYGASNPFALLPEWPVGRIPGAAGDDPDLLLRLLEHAAAAQPADLAAQPAWLLHRRLASLIGRGLRRDRCARAPAGFAAGGGGHA